MTTIERTEKALLQEDESNIYNPFCVAWFASIGLRRVEKWFETFGEAKNYFDKIK